MPSLMHVKKSEEIRKLIASGVTSGSEIVARLKACGIRVAPSQAFALLAAARKKSTKKRTRAMNK